MPEQDLQLELIKDQKRAAWGKMGVAIWQTESALQLRAQQITSKLIAPTKPADLPNAEQALKVAQKDLDTLEADRKKITGTLNEVIDRLMISEKNVGKALKDYIADIIKVKKQQEEENKKQQAKENELKQIVDKVRLYIADMNAAYLKEHAKLISDSYKHALENIPPEKLEEYLIKVRSRITIQKRTMPPPAYNATINEQAAVDAKIKQVFNPLSAETYIEGFNSDLALKYSDYKLAWENKTQALELNTQEAAENEHAIDLQKQQDVVAATVQSLAVTGLVETTTKELKKVYKLDMEDKFESANILLTAYLANSAKCRNELRITKWLTGFGTKQIIGALEKLKNDDPNFDFTGLVWKTEDKL